MTLFIKAVFTAKNKRIVPRRSHGYVVLGLEMLYLIVDKQLWKR